MAGGPRPWAAVWLALCCWTNAAWAQPAPRPRGPVVDRVVALVDGALLSQLDLELEASVVLVEGGAVEAIPDEQFLSRALEQAINERLLTRDADRLQSFPVEPATLEVKLRDFEARFGAGQGFERFLARFEATRAMLGQVLARKIRAERILDSKFRLRSQVGEEEARQYYDAHAAELGADYDKIHQSLRDRLTAERFARLVAAELRAASAQGRHPAGGALRHAGGQGGAMRKMQPAAEPGSFRIRPMALEDLQAVMEIENRRSATPGPGAAQARAVPRLVHHAAGARSRASRRGDEAAGLRHLLAGARRAARAQRGDGSGAAAAGRGPGGDERGAGPRPGAQVHPGHPGGAPRATRRRSASTAPWASVRWASGPTTMWTKARTRS